MTEPTGRSKREERQAGEDSVVLIDENNLDKECIRLPFDYLKFARLAADAKRDVDEAKASLDVTQAEIAKKIRLKPEDYGLDKVTEAAISTAILLQGEYVEAQDILIRSRHRYDLHQAVVWALEHKKRTLTLLVELHGMGYFSNVKMSKEGKEAVEEMTKTKVRKIGRAD